MTITTQGLETSCACGWLDVPPSPCECPCHDPAPSVKAPTITVEPGRRGGWDVVEQYPSGAFVRVGHHTAKYRAIEQANALRTQRETPS